LRAFLPDVDLDVFFNQHNPPADGQYPIRGVVLFGLAEMERAKLFADAMKDNQVEDVGRLMNISHDGDRVIAIDPDETETPYQAPTSNDFILNLIHNLTERYYSPQARPPTILICRPIAGSNVLLGEKAR